jgi:phenylalanyl-tRNA synthetase beta chain
MKVPISWLREFVDVKVEPARLAEDLTLAGLEAGALEADGGETILDLDVTTNRVDCMNVYGVAREVSALYDLPLEPLALDFEERGAPATQSLTVAIQAPELCSRFTARIWDVQIGVSPDWMRTRLEQVGVRPLGNIVDLTNYVMMEIGQPCHAFDHARLAESRLEVRWAREGEGITTLDGAERQLHVSAGVVADARGPQGLAGIMGGADSEVGDDTRVVVLEAAAWNPVAIRRAAKALAIHTEASHRFERSADPRGPLLAQARLGHLLYRTGAGSVRPGMVDVAAAPYSPRVVMVHFPRIGALLGAEIAASESRRVLAGLGFVEKESDAEGTRFEVPTWRGDVSREADVIEEVGRHHGLGSIPSTLPPARGLVGLRPYQVRERRLRTYLEAVGLSEVINYSFVAASEDQVSLENPLSAEEGQLRSSLVAPGLVETLRTNLRQGRRDVRVFEVGRVFLPRPGDRPAEPKRLGVLLAGPAENEHWNVAQRPSDFFDAKGLVEGLFRRLGFEPPELESSSVSIPAYIHPGRSAAISWRGQTIGFLGAIHPAQGDEWSLRDETLVIEIDLNPLLGATPPDARAQALPRFPAIERDLSLFCDQSTPSARWVSTARAAGGELLREVRIIDRYDRPPVPTGCVSLSLGLRYQAIDRTLTNDEVQLSVEAVIERLRRAGAEIRGE